MVSNYLSITNLQWWRHWNLEMCQYFHLTLYQAYYYLYVLGLEYSYAFRLSHLQQLKYHTYTQINHIVLTNMVIFRYYGYLCALLGHILIWYWCQYLTLMTWFTSAFKKNQIILGQQFDNQIEEIETLLYLSQSSNAAICWPLYWGLYTWYSHLNSVVV